MNNIFSFILIALLLSGILIYLLRFPVYYATGNKQTDLKSFCYAMFVSSLPLVGVFVSSKVLSFSFWGTVEAKDRKLFLLLWLVPFISAGIIFLLKINKYKKNKN